MSASVAHLMIATAFFNTSSGTNRDAGGGRSGFLGKTFITLSHVKTDLSGIQRHNLSLERRNRTLRLQTGQSNCRDADGVIVA